MHEDLLKIKQKEYKHHCLDCNHEWTGPIQESTCRNCNSIKLNITDVPIINIPKIPMK